jgi:hypothetical protein
MSNQLDELSCLCSELVEVLYEDESWNTHRTIANLEEISPSSAILLSDEYPQPWHPIAISAKGHDLYGIVESVEVDEILGCFIKVKLEAPHRWRKELFMPDHCLALDQSTSEPNVSNVRTTVKSFALGRR